MIPILYSHEETAFSNEGIGRINCLSCKVTEEINGIPECEFKVLTTEPIYQYIRLGSIIYTTHDESKDPQPYEIYAYSEPLDDVVTFNARHIVGRLRNIVVEPYTASGVGLALQGLKSHSIGGNPFTFITTKSTVADFELKVPTTAKDVLGGVRGSILDTYTGEYEFDDFTVKMHNQIGINSGVEIRYGSNLVGYKHEQDLADTYNAVVPFWRNEESGILVTLPEQYIIVGTVQDQYAFLTDHLGEYIQTDTNEPIEVVSHLVWFSPLDLTETFETAPTVAQLREAATAYMNNNRPYIPSENYDVDFIQLWQTGEYPQYEGLQRVHLGDTVSVYYPSVNVSVDSIRVVKTVYDSLLERYESMTLGQKHATFANTIDGAVDEAIRKMEIVDYDVMNDAIKNATALLTGEYGGNIVFEYDANGQPREMLIMDTTDKDTAQNVWRFNASGWGHSSTGIEGPYRLAATQDGSIVADFITSGQLNAGLITTGEMSANRIKGGTFDGQYINVVNLSASNVDMNGVFDNVYYDPDADVTENHVTIDGGSVLLTLPNGQKLASLEAPYYSSGTYYGHPLGGSLRLWDYDGRKMLTADAFYDGLYLDICDSNGNTVLHFQPNWINFTPQGTNCTFSIGQSGVNISGAQVTIDSSLTVYGSKNRAIKTKSYGTRLLYAYETAEPYFSDIGESVIGEDGTVTVSIERIFSETVDLDGYHVFLQKYGEGDCWVERRDSDSFTVRGTAGLRFGWEIKAKQIDHNGLRLGEVKQ